MKKLYYALFFIAFTLLFLLDERMKFIRQKYTLKLTMKKI